MSKKWIILFVAMGMIFLSQQAVATNGDNLIAIGPYARAMGGVGIAHPQDAIGAVFANPAAMCFGPYCPSSEANAGVTFFMPDVDARVSTPSLGGTIKDDSDADFFMIPAVGFSAPIGKSEKNWRFGFAAYGVSGLGVDYEGGILDNTSYPIVGAPAVAGTYTELQRLKLAPSIAVQPTANLSFGLALHIGYSTLDINADKEDDFAYGIQPGLIYRFTDHLSMGITYISPMKYSHKDVSDFNGDGLLDELELESPHTLGVGLAYDFFEKSLLVEPFGQKVRQTHSALVRSGETALPLAVPATALTTGTRARLRIFPNLASQLGAAMEGIMRRPYGCAEQIISAAWGFLLDCG